MGISFNADEIFEMAVEIERNGGIFYREAAGNCSDDEVKKVLLDMAAMEDGHLKTFEEMRKGLSDAEKEPNSFDPGDEAAMYLQSMADAHGHEGKVSVDKKLTGNESPKEIFEIALNAEKDSVVFYYGLRQLVSEKAGREQVDAVIKEELKHIATLNKYLQSVN